MFKKIKDEIITAERHINDEIFWKFFNHQIPSYLLKDLLEGKLAKNKELVNNINDALTDLRNVIIKKETPKNENPNKTINIVEKVLEFNNQQKSRRLKILTPKQKLQRLPLALAQIKAGNTSDNILSKI